MITPSAHHHLLVLHTKAFKELDTLIYRGRHATSPEGHSDLGALPMTFNTNPAAVSNGLTGPTNGRSSSLSPPLAVNAVSRLYNNRRPAFQTCCAPWLAWRGAGYNTYFDFDQWGTLMGYPFRFAQAADSDTSWRVAAAAITDTSRSGAMSINEGHPRSYHTSLRVVWPSSGCADDNEPPDEKATSPLLHQLNSCTCSSRPPVPYVYPNGRGLSK